MNPYLLTLTFLMVMSILTSSEVLRFKQNHFGNRLYAGYQEKIATTENLQARADYDDFRARESHENPTPDERREVKQKTRVRRSAPLGFDLSRPPNNSRLNLYVVLHEEKLYDTAVRLINSLYQGAPFFQEIPNAASRILDALIAQKESTLSFTFPDELASLTFDDPSLQKLFYTMLRGGKEYPSLLDFVTFDNITRDGETKRVSLLFAHPILIEALLDNEPLSEKFLALRDSQWEEIIDQELHRLARVKEDCKGRGDFKKELKEGLERIMLEAGLDSKERVFDLSLGKLGSIVYVEDPKTGLAHREKHYQKKRT